MDRNRTSEIRGRQAFPSLENDPKLERHLANTRALRARAVAEALITAGPAMDALLSALGTWLIRLHRRRQTYHALMGCSDRVLADIGIAREHIPLIARGIDPGQYDINKAGGRWWWHAIRLRLEMASRAWRERRRIYRELMAYNDHDLDDLGIRRADIPAVARGRLPTPA